MKKCDRELALHELNNCTLLEHIVETMAILNRLLPEKELREKDRLYNACALFLAALFSTAEEKWNPQRRLAYRQQYSFKYYQDGILEARKYIWGLHDILLPAWEPKSKQVKEKLARVQEKKATISANMDAAIKRGEHENTRALFADTESLANFLEKHYLPFHAAQVRKHAGLPTPLPEYMKGEDLCYMRYKFCIREIKKQYSDPLPQFGKYSIKTVFENRYINQNYYIDIFMQKMISLGYIKTYTSSKKAVFDLIEKNALVRKTADLHDEYVKSIQPLLDREYEKYFRSMRNNHFIRVSNKIYFLDDDKIDAFIEYMTGMGYYKQKELYDYDIRTCITNYGYGVENEDMYNTRGSARKIAEEWGIIPKEEADVRTAV